MTEVDAIDAAIDVLVAYNVDDLDQLANVDAQLTAITALITAYTDADIDAFAAACEAGHKKGRDCIQLLITWIQANYTKRYKS